MISRFFIDRPIFATVLSVVITLLGGIALSQIGKTPSVYLALFAISTFARLGALVLLWRVPREGEGPQQPRIMQIPERELSERVAA